MYRVIVNACFSISKSATATGWNNSRHVPALHSAKSQLSSTKYSSTQLRNYAADRILFSLKEKIRVNN